MFKIKLLLLIGFALTSTLTYGQFTDVINSNRPGASMAAFSVGKTIIQAELGVNGIKEKNDPQYYKADDYNVDLSLRYGLLLEQLELIVNLEYQNEKYINTTETFKRSGLKKTAIGAKFLLYDPEKNYEKKPNLYSYNANHKFNWRQFVPAVGIYGGINFNFSNEIFMRPLIPIDTKFNLKGMLLTQNQFGKYTFLTNIILDKFPGQKQSIDYVVTLTRGFSPQWSGLLETQGFNGTFYKDSYLRVGAAYLVQQNIQIDASIGTNFKNTPSLLFGGIGVSWRFDDNYSDVLLRIPKEAKGKDDKGKKKDKKDKSKKRLDEVVPEEKTK